MTTVGVAHLVRATNGIAPFRRFLDSYRAHPAGCDHELLLLCKGFRARDELRPYQELLGDIRCRALWLPDIGFDIRPYFVTAQRFAHPFFCFLNSYSVILADGWLAKLYQHITRPGIGLVGASGCYASPYTNLLRERMRPPPETLLRRLRNTQRLLNVKYYFHPFPNPHIRTNAFVVGRELLLSLKRGPTLRKIDALRFEHGKQGLTQQVLQCGLRALVVGRDGEGYEVGDWHQSGTFCVNEQHNLLVRDNRTDDYQYGTAATRRFLEWFSWGIQASAVEVMQ